MVLEGFQRFKGLCEYFNVAAHSAPGTYCTQNWTSPLADVSNLRTLLLENTCTWSYLCKTKFPDGYNSWLVDLG